MATDFAKRRTAYISGPMTGLPDLNYPAFHEAEAALAAAGWKVVNPARHFGGDQARGRAEYMRADLAALLDGVDTVFMLPGWQNSAGARLEREVAKQLDLSVLATSGAGGVVVEDEAQDLVRNGERQDTYGHPAKDFERTAKIWSGILGTGVTPEDVALMMAGLKISRLKSTPHHTDSVIDGIGYLVCYSRLAEE